MGITRGTRVGGVNRLEALHGVEACRHTGVAPALYCGNHSVVEFVVSVQGRATSGTTGMDYWTAGVSSGRRVSTLR